MNSSTLCTALFAFWHPSIFIGLLKLSESNKDLKKSSFDSKSKRSSGRGCFEFVWWLTGVLSALFSSSYLSPELNCSFFPAVWMLKCHCIVWDVPPMGEEALDYVFMCLCLCVWLWGWSEKTQLYSLYSVFFVELTLKQYTFPKRHGVWLQRI